MDQEKSLRRKAGGASPTELRQDDKPIMSHAKPCDKLGPRWILRVSQHRLCTIDYRSSAPPFEAMLYELIAIVCFLPDGVPWR